MDDLAIFQQLRLFKAAFIYLHTLLGHENMTSHKSRKDPLTLMEFLQVTLCYLRIKNTFTLHHFSFKYLLL